MNILGSDTSWERKKILLDRMELEKTLEGKGVEEFLHNLVQDGYLLHGSSYLNKVLEPRQAADTQGVPENEQKAVYATNIPAIALYISLVSPDAIQEQRMSFVYGCGTKHQDGVCVPYFSADKGVESIMRPGYVYVLPPDSFVPTSGHPLEEQFVSYTSVVPVMIVPTERGDFDHTIEAR